MKWFLCRWLCPGFIKQCPADDNGEYYAGVEIYSHFHCYESKREKVSGRRSAYYRARWLALKEDWRAPDELGVRWFIESVK